MQAAHIPTRDLDTAKRAIDVLSSAAQTVERSAQMAAAVIGTRAAVRLSVARLKCRMAFTDVYSGFAG